MRMPAELGEIDQDWQLARYARKRASMCRTTGARRTQPSIPPGIGYIDS